MTQVLRHGERQRHPLGTSGSYGYICCRGSSHNHAEIWGEVLCGFGFDGACLWGCLSVSEKRGIPSAGNITFLSTCTLFLTGPFPLTGWKRASEKGIFMASNVDFDPSNPRSGAIRTDFEGSGGCSFFVDQSARFIRFALRTEYPPVTNSP